MRLEKFLSQSGIASRRDAKKYISAGRVSVDGEKGIDSWHPHQSAGR